MKTDESVIVSFILGGTHTRDCPYGTTNNDEGDFCTCKYPERKERLYKLLDEIRELKNSSSRSPALLAEIEMWKAKYQAIEDIYKAFNTSTDAIQQLLNEILAGRKAQAELQRLKEQNTGKASELRRIANIVHHGGLIGFGDTQKAIAELARLTLSYWDQGECVKLQREQLLGGR